MTPEELKNERFQQEQRLQFYRAILPWGYMDVDVAIANLTEADVDFGDFGEFVENELQETDDQFDDLDPVALSMECIISKVDGAEDLRNHISANYCCSSFDLDDEEAAAILYEVDEGYRGSEWRWLVKETDAESALDARLRNLDRPAMLALIEQAECDSEKSDSDEQMRATLRDAMIEGWVLWSDLPAVKEEVTV